MKSLALRAGTDGVRDEGEPANGKWRNGREVLDRVIRNRLEQAPIHTIVLAVVSSVYPSGGAFATASVPMLPLAPARLSTTMATFQSSPIFWPSVLARMSMPVRA
jgi:hypothetical protein